MPKNLLLCLFLLLTSSSTAMAQASKQIRIETKNTTLILSVGEKERLYQTYFGDKLAQATDYQRLPTGNHEAYVPAGLNDLFEPAIRMVHNDGNPSLELRYVRHTTDAEANGQTHTAIVLQDPKYPVEVTLHFSAYAGEDVLKTWMVVQHREKKPVVLSRFASAMLHFEAPHYWLTQFHGDWAEEMRPQEAELTSGIKVIDSKLGTRAHMYQAPHFMLALNKPATENEGELILGTLAWSGNFQLAFELDEHNALRVLSGMNPYASEYQLAPNQPFETPAFIFTYSHQGKNLASRNLHRWARQYGGVLDGTKSRLTLLNNWEATFFDFNEQKLDALIGDASKLGVDLFLLDDGWFGNKYPRSNDNAGLGDWQETKSKLPNGLGHLVQTATQNNVKFGIWIEPEMVNPKSELYENHPDWILKLPNREEHYYRNQLVLDLTNPKVQDFVFGVVDELFTKNPTLGYIKWDSNRMITNAFSPYLKNKQSNLYIDYLHGLYKVFERMRRKYPHVPVMLCSGGGGRVDYGALPYFTEFWASDNTDALERVFIQWNYSYFFPSIAVSAHVTSWNKQQSLKFRTDVAMMGRLGYDIRVEEFTPQELQFSQQAVKEYKRLSDVIWHGDLYRLVSPLETSRAVVQYVNEARSQAVVFAYTLRPRFGEEYGRVRLQGLDPSRQYRVQEINLMPGAKSNIPENSQTYSGDFLMKVGVLASTASASALTSHVLEITAQ
ncbi:alpha-galactosidase [Hymenobacter crusticola]|uniref:Alpha-galactosidase n=1 Tax=Hymenobacter crusticola TaxID=1770526 RepID=A0A243W7X8_9BACT|nr:alpha-galactosidase [Hymenobacter crusticola]OUJ71144.1 alpha-galactosidase [Hymenobacter crusticola]